MQVKSFWQLLVLFTKCLQYLLSRQRVGLPCLATSCLDRGKWLVLVNCLWTEVTSVNFRSEHLIICKDFTEHPCFSLKINVNVSFFVALQPGSEEAWCRASTWPIIDMPVEKKSTSWYEMPFNFGCCFLMKYNLAY